MKKSLRIYMKNSAKIKSGFSFWKKLWNPSLSFFILSEAKKSEIDQAVLLSVKAGYLKGSTVTYSSTEYVPRDFPLVLELIDDENRLVKFYEFISEQLSDEFVVLQDLQKLKNMNTYLNDPKEI